MHLTKAEVFKKFNRWLTAWNMHDLETVMDFIHADIVFENWDGTVVRSKEILRKSWLPWFIRHSDFKFIQEDVFFDEQEQKMTFQWRLEWFSAENKLKGKNESKSGVDILHFRDGKIYRKCTYSKIPEPTDRPAINANTLKHVHTL